MPQIRYDLYYSNRKFYLAEDREVEVVVVVGDGDLARHVDPDADGVVGDAWRRG